MQYKVGDNFRITKGLGKGLICEILEVNEIERKYIIKYPDNSTSSSWYDSGDMELVTNMQKLGAMLKRLLDEDSQTLYKAGYLDGDLKLTTKGMEALNSIIFDANKADLVKLAQDDLDEENDK